MAYIVIHIEEDNTVYTVEFEGTKHSENDSIITFQRVDGQYFTYEKEKVVKYEIN